MDRRGVPGWGPFVRELVWQPDSPIGVPSAWSDPVGGLIPVGPGQLVLSRQWLVELVAGGLWIRPADGSADAEVVRRIPADSRRCTVVVSGAHSPRVRPPWRTIARLLRALPPDARSVLQVAVPADAEELAVDAVRACARELGNRPVQVLGADGVVVPRYVALPVNRLLAFLGFGQPVMRLGYRPRGRYASHRLGAQPAAANRVARASRDPDAVQLLTFIDRIRRTPSWDETREPSASPARPQHLVVDRLPDQIAPPAAPAVVPAPARVEPARLDPPNVPVDQMQVVNRVGRHRADEEPAGAPTAVQARRATRPVQRGRHQAPLVREDGR